MAERPRVLVAGPAADLHAQDLRRDGRFLVPAVSPSVAEAVPAVIHWKPDVVVFDVAGGETHQQDAVETIAREAPFATVVVISQSPDLHTATAFMQAGADGYLLRPFRPDYLADYTFHLHQRVAGRKRQWVQKKLDLVNPRRPHLVAVFSPKGGVGKTTLAANLAVSLRMETSDPVTLLDMDLESGDAATLLDLAPRRTVVDYARALTAGDEVDLAGYLTTHHTGLRLLAAPSSPEQAEAVRPDHVRAAIAAAKQSAEFVVADTSPIFSEPVLAVLDQADTILLVLTPDVTSLKNVRTALEVMNNLQYRMEKIRPVMNRCSEDHGLTVAQVEEVLGRPVLTRIPTDAPLVTAATNAGKPFVHAAPDTPIARTVADLGRQIVKEARDGQAPAPRPGRGGFLRRLLQRHD